MERMSTCLAEVCRLYKRLAHEDINPNENYYAPCPKENVVKNTVR